MVASAFPDPLAPECRPFSLRRQYDPPDADTPAARLMYCRDPVILLDGPTGSGKTRPTLEKSFHCADRWLMRGLFLRKNKAHTSGSIMATWREEVVPPGHPAAVLQTKNYESPTYRFPNGSTIAVDGMYDGKGYNLAVMGTFWDWVVMEEGTQFSDDDFMRLNGRMDRSNPGPGRIPFTQLIIPTNPDAPTHWLWQLHLDGKITRIQTRLEDNPVYHDGRDWTEQGRKYLARIAHYSGVLKQRNRDGLWVGAEGMIFHQWDESVHVLRADGKPNQAGHSLPPDFADLWRVRAVDFGHTEPFVCLWGAVDADGRIYVDREYIKAQATINTNGQRVKRLTPTRQHVQFTVADHDAGDRAVLRDMGIETVRAIKPKAGETWISHFEPLWQRLATAPDGKPRLFVVDNSVQAGGGRDPMMRGKPIGIREEITGYAWKQPREGESSRERPDQRNDHAMDALRYLVHAVDKWFDGSLRREAEPYPAGTLGDMLGLDPDDPV